MAALDMCHLTRIACWREVRESETPLSVMSSLGAAVWQPCLPCGAVSRGFPAAWGEASPERRAAVAHGFCAGGVT
jgi:hypothetical protein